MKSRWVEHKGKRVFIADFSNFGTNSAGLLAECSEILKELPNEPPNSVLVISDVSGTVATPGNLDVLKSILPVSNHFVKKRAVVGMAGARKDFLEFFIKLTGRASLNPFESMEEALDFLVKDE